MSDIAVAPAAPVNLIPLRYLWWVAGALALLVAVIVSGDLWALDFTHVMAGLLWTGIDLFMGFVMGPILRVVELPVRRAIILRLMPKMIFLMPTLSITTGTAGWFLAERMGYLGLGWPEFGWVAAALVIITLLTVQGLGILLPTNLRVCLELQKPSPDFPKIGRLMRTYVRAVAFQGAMQVAIIVIMARFATGV